MPSESGRIECRKNQQGQTETNINHTSINRCLVMQMAFFAFIISLITPLNCMAKVETIYVSHKYVLGDNDSRNDARKMCFLEAKRKVIEKAGTYIESFTEVKKAKLTKDEVFAYSSALLKVETVKENWQMSGGNMTVILKVKAEVDTGNLKKKLSNIRNDKSIKNSVIKQQKQLRNLEIRVIQLQIQLGAVDSEKAASLRKDRNVIFKEIDELESKRIKILSVIKKTSKNALKYVERGMTPSEVAMLIGKARAYDSRFGYSLLQWNYGAVWVIFESNIVACIVKSSCFDKSTTCQFYSQRCILK
jgi:hypothetical protein